MSNDLTSPETKEKKVNKALDDLEKSLKERPETFFCSKFVLTDGQTYQKWWIEVFKDYKLYQPEVLFLNGEQKIRLHNLYQNWFSKYGESNFQKA